MKAKNYRVECLSEQVFKITKTKFLKKRLIQLKKKPKKNQYGISRIQEELDKRLMEEIDAYLAEQEEMNSLLDEIDEHFKNNREDSTEPEEEDEYQPYVRDEALQRVREMKECLSQKIRDDPDFHLKLRANSDKLKVFGEARCKDEDKIYGYLVENISSEALRLEYSEDEIEILCPGELALISLERFVSMAAAPEFSFTLSNGLVKSTIPLAEVLKMEKETGQKYILSNYRVIPKMDAEPIPIIYIK